MYQYEEYLEEDFIIWNSELGVRDFVTIGEVDSKKNHAWLEEPYEMVGPFCLDELCAKGQISFEACIVMSEDKWQERQALLRQESFFKQCKREEKFYKEVNQHNKKREQYQTQQEQLSQKEYRKLLCLPLEGKLEDIQIKTAYKKMAKTTHPDVGGSHELFVKLTQAKDALLGN